MRKTSKILENQETERNALDNDQLSFSDENHGLSCLHLRSDLQVTVMFWEPQQSAACFVHGDVALGQNLGAFFGWQEPFGMFSVVCSPGFLGFDTLPCFNVHEPRPQHMRLCIRIMSWFQLPALVEAKDGPIEKEMFALCFAETGHWFWKRVFWYLR